MPGWVYNVELPATRRAEQVLPVSEPRVDPVEAPADARRRDTVRWSRCFASQAATNEDDFGDNRFMMVPAVVLEAVAVMITTRHAGSRRFAQVDGQRVSDLPGRR